MATRLPIAFVAMLGCAEPGFRRFSDRPVAWHEHDDETVRVAPRSSHWQRWSVTLRLRDFFEREVNRSLAFETPSPAADVNALDEVPCSTWFCPRNHLSRMSPSEVLGGPPGVVPPSLPLRIMSGKEGAAGAGFIVMDKRGRRYVLKLDPGGKLGLVTGAEAVGARLFFAAGYNVAGAYVIELAEEDLTLDPSATYSFHGFERRKHTRASVEGMLSKAARTRDGRIRAVAIPWIEGEVLGAFDFMGVRADDPNDRIAHERRRSLRASYVLFAWINEADGGAANTLDSYVGEGGRRFVRHYVIDFGGALGAWSGPVKMPEIGYEYAINIAKWVQALLKLGTFEQPWQEKSSWQRAIGRHPAIGWLPVLGWEPDSFRTTRKVPAHLRMTERDAYWGAKIVTAFSDEQIDAAVAAGEYDPFAAAYISYALRARRDLIARRYLTRVTALEAPAVRGGQLCFEDLVIARQVVGAPDVRYSVRILGPSGQVIHAERIFRATSGESCVPLPSAAEYPYIVTSVATQTIQRAARAARVHLAARGGEYVVVGLERDD